MSDAPMMKKRGRQEIHCDDRHCVSGIDAAMAHYTKSRQRNRERREWQTEWTTQSIARDADE